jgi:acetyltransferase-like isoleucine patch superfamily enzyme
MLQKIKNKFIYTLRSIKFRIYALSKGSLISLNAIIHIEKEGKINIGRGVRIMPNSHISVLKNGLLEINDDVNIGRGVVIFCAKKIEIGLNSRIAHYVTIVDHDYEYKNIQTNFKSRIIKPVKIGRNSWLAANCIVLKGVNIGAGSVIAAGTVVTKDIPEKSIVYDKKNNIVKSFYE